MHRSGSDSFFSTWTEGMECYRSSGLLLAARDLAYESQAEVAFEALALREQPIFALVECLY